MHFPMDADDAGGILIDLTAIYRSREYGIDKFWDEDAYGPQTVDERYWVLWLEWIDGIAYRLAIGSVDKDA